MRIEPPNWRVLSWGAALGLFVSLAGTVAVAHEPGVARTLALEARPDGLWAAIHLELRGRRRLEALAPAAATSRLLLSRPTQGGPPLDLASAKTATGAHRRPPGGSPSKPDEVWARVLAPRALHGIELRDEAGPIAFPSPWPSAAVRALGERIELLLLVRLVDRGRGRLSVGLEPGAEPLTLRVIGSPIQARLEEGEQRVFELGAAKTGTPAPDRVDVNRGSPSDFPLAGTAGGP